MIHLGLDDALSSVTRHPVFESACDLLQTNISSSPLNPLSVTTILSTF